MAREQGEVGEFVNARPKSSGDAPAACRRRGRRRLFSTPKQGVENCDRRGAVGSQHLKRTQPWMDFADTTKFSIPKSTEEVISRMKSNVDHFCINYGVIFLVILASCFVTSISLVVSVIVVGAVCAALNLHDNDEAAVQWGTRLMVSKKHRLGAAALVALPLLHAADIWAAVIWSLSAALVIAIVHSTLYAELGSHKSFAKNRDDDIMDPLE
ncbi:hypothetical protein HPB49_010734 [Dermacentor silvarum]|uniref:Uncharacterized protein n=1 Tax=Dermacentor silvarum TaxID=543639 RepID=A0ACB8E073_DERSI|nr:hypothetical protein HPB49_010734 [Dermacentor silvarum]